MPWLRLNRHFGRVLIMKLSNKVISALRLPSKCSFTLGKLRFFGLRKP